MHECRKCVCACVCVRDACLFYRTDHRLCTVPDTPALWHMSWMCSHHPRSGEQDAQCVQMPRFLDIRVNAVVSICLNAPCTCGCSSRVNSFFVAQRVQVHTCRMTRLAGPVEAGDVWDCGENLNLLSRTLATERAATKQGNSHMCGPGLS